MCTDENCRQGDPIDYTADFTTGPDGFIAPHDYEEDKKALDRVMARAKELEEEKESFIGRHRIQLTRIHLLILELRQKAEGKDHLIEAIKDEVKGYLA